MKNKDVFIEVSELRAIGSDNNNWMLLKRTKKKDQKTGAALGGYSEWSGYKYYSSLGSAAAKLAIRGYTSSILTDRTGVTLELGDVPQTAAILVPLAVAVVGLVLASLRLQRLDVA